jgi:hypothetical protein
MGTIERAGACHAPAARRLLALATAYPAPFHADQVVVALAVHRAEGGEVVQLALLRHELQGTPELEGDLLSACLSVDRGERVEFTVRRGATNHRVGREVDFRALANLPRHQLVDLLLDHRAACRCARRRLRVRVARESGHEGTHVNSGDETSANSQEHWETSKTSYGIG